MIELKLAEGKVERLPELAAEVPVELPTKVEPAINRKTANAFGVVMPQPLLMRADEVIQ